jgi:hypothetical protein
MRHAARKIVLADYRRCRAEPFAWGSADCLAFAASCAEESKAAIRSRSARAPRFGNVGMARVIKEGWRQRRRTGGLAVS